MTLSQTFAGLSSKSEYISVATVAISTSSPILPPPSDRDALDLIERDLIAGAIIELRQRALRAREDAERPLLHVLSAVDRDIGAGHERHLVRA